MDLKKRIEQLEKHWVTDEDKPDGIVICRVDFRKGAKNVDTPVMKLTAGEDEYSRRDGESYKEFLHRSTQTAKDKMVSGAIPVFFATGSIKEET